MSVKVFFLGLLKQTSGLEGKVDPDKHRKAEFLFPETTKDFETLPLEFRVSNQPLPFLE